METKPCAYLGLILIIFFLSMCVYTIPFAIMENNHCKTYSSAVTNQPSKTYFILGKGLCPSYSKFSVAVANVSAAAASVNATTTATDVVSMATTGTSSSSSGSTKSSGSYSTVIIYNSNNNDDTRIQNIDYKNCAPIFDASYTAVLICLSFVFFYIFVYVFCESLIIFSTCFCCDLCCWENLTISIYFYDDHKNRTILKNLYFIYFVLFSIGAIFWHIGYYIVFLKTFLLNKECRNYTSDGFNLWVANSFFVVVLQIYSFFKFLEIYVPPNLEPSSQTRVPNTYTIERLRPSTPSPLLRQEPTQVLNLKHVQRRIGMVDNAPPAAAPEIV